MERVSEEKRMVSIDFEKCFDGYLSGVVTVDSKATGT